MTKEEVKQIQDDLKEDLNKVLIKLKEVQTLQDRRQEESLNTVGFDELNLLTLKTAIQDVLNGTNKVTDMFDEYAMSYN